MGTVSQSAAARPAIHIAGRGGLVDKYFYFAMSLLVAGIVVSGFSQTVDENLLHASPARPLILWFHGGAFSIWVLFFIFQSALVRTRNVKWHRFFGWFGAGLGTAMVLLGVSTAIVMARFHTYTLKDPSAAAFLIVPFFDISAFATLFGLAVWWRRKPEMHRRFIFIATCVLLAAAFGRFPYLGDHLLFYWGVDSVILLGVVRDLLVNRRVHRIYLIALPVLIVCQMFAVHTYASASAWWLKFADGMLG